MDEKQKLGPRPADPSQISFAPDCFECVGEEVVYTTYNRTGYGYPKRWRTLEEATEYAKRTGHIVDRSVYPKMTRIKWR